MLTGNAFFRFIGARFRGAAKIEMRLWAPLETLIVTAIAILIGHYWIPQNPLGLQAGFPWLLFFPLLIALRYRSLYGVLSELIIVLFFKDSLNRVAWLPYMVGSFGLVLLIGEFSHAWFRRVRKSVQKYTYTGQRLDALSRAYYLLKLSHSHLEESLITKPVTLRKIVEEIRQLTIEGKGGFNPKALKLLLDMLSQYCGVITAVVVEAKNKKITDVILANTGEKMTLKKDDPLLLKIDEAQGVRYQTIENLSKRESDYLAVAPVMTSKGNVIAYLVIKDMIFSSLSETTMQTLSVLLAYFANDVESYESSETLLSLYPDCPSKFALEFRKMIDLHVGLGVSSYLVSIFMKKSDESDYMIKKFLGIQRGLDCSWVIEQEDQVIHINLMPFSNSVAVIGYLSRIDGWFKQEFGKTMKDFCCHHTVKPVTTNAAEKQIEACLDHHV